MYALHIIFEESLLCVAIVSNSNKIIVNTIFLYISSIYKIILINVESFKC